MANQWEERVKRAGFVRRTMFQQGTTFGRSRPAFGDIELVNSAALDAEGDLDYLNDLALDGRSITIYYGDTDDVFPSDFTPLYTASMEQALVARERVTVRVLGNSARVDQPFRTTFFGGAGGVDGSPNLLGKPKPYTFGRVNNVSPVLIDSDLNLYQVHDSAFNAISVYGDGADIPQDDQIRLSVNNNVQLLANHSFYIENTKEFIRYVPDANPSNPATYYLSDDFFATQSTGTSNINGATSLNSYGIVSDGSTYYAIRNQNTSDPNLYLITSTDLITWSLVGSVANDLSVPNNGAKIFYNEALAQFIILYADNSSQTVVLTSPDGLTYTEATRLSGGLGVYGNVIWAGGSEQRYILYKSNTFYDSVDGLTWSEISGTSYPSGTAGNLEDVYYNEDVQLFFGSGTTGFASSPDLLTWDIINSQPFSRIARFGRVRADETGRLLMPYSIQDATVSPNTFEYYADVSNDGITWEQITLGWTLTFAPNDQIYFTRVYDRWLFGQLGALGSSKFWAYVFDYYLDAADAERPESVPTTGTYKPYTAGGIFRLGDTQSGTVTTDVTVGATAADRTVAKGWTTVLDEVGENYDSTSVNVLDSLVPYECGFYLDTNPVETSLILDDLANSVGAFWGDDASGTFRIAQVNDPVYETPISTVYDYDMTKPLERLQSQDEGRGIPFWRVALNYNRRYTVQESGLDASVTAARREELAQPYDTVSNSDTAIRTQHPLAPELIINTLLLDETDTSVEAQRVFDLRSIKRDRFEFEVKLDDNTVTWDVGDVIKVVHPRFGLASGKHFVIIGLTINPGPQTLTINIWG